MTAPLISGLAAYMLVTGKIIPWWHMVVWMCVVLHHRRADRVSDEAPLHQRRAAALSRRARRGVVLDALYTGAAARGHVQGAPAGHHGGRHRRLPIHHQRRLDEAAAVQAPPPRPMGGPEGAVDVSRAPRHVLLRRGIKANLLIPTILGTDIRQLGLRLTLDAAMLGVGGLMGIAVATSCLLGAFINFVILAPIMIQAGDIVARVGPTGATVPIIARRDRQPVVAVVGRHDDGGRLAGEPVRAARDLQRHFQTQRQKHDGTDVLKHIEFPLWISAVGVPVFSVLGAWVTHEFFGVPWLLAFISLPLIFVLSIICTNSMALTSWTPTGSLSKITQFTMGAIDRTNPASNLIPAGMTGEIASNAANLLSDIKPGYMLGAKPRQQAIGHVIGIFAGALSRACRCSSCCSCRRTRTACARTATMVSDQFAFPAALQWKGVAELIAKGISALPYSAIVSMVVAAVSAVAIEIARIATKGRFPAVGGVDRAWRRAAARSHVRDVGRRVDFLADGSALQTHRHAWSRSSGSKVWSRSAPD